MRGLLTEKIESDSQLQILTEFVIYTFALFTHGNVLIRFFVFVSCLGLCFRFPLKPFPFTTSCGSLVLYSLNIIVKFLWESYLHQPSPL